MTMTNEPTAAAEDLNRLHDAADSLLREHDFAINDHDMDIVVAVSDPDVLNTAAQLIEDAVSAIACGRNTCGGNPHTHRTFAEQVRQRALGIEEPTEPTEPVELAIRPNNCLMGSWCALCGIRNSEDMVDLYLAGTYKWVCIDCGAVEAPDLAAALLAWWQAERVMYAPHRAPEGDPIDADDLLAAAAGLVADAGGPFEPEDDDPFADDYSERRFTAERYNALGLAILQASGHPPARVGSQPSPPPEEATSEAVTRALRLLDGLYFFDREALADALNLKTVRSADDVHRFARELVGWAMTDGESA